MTVRKMKGKIRMGAQVPGPRGLALLDDLRLLQRHPLAFLTKVTRSYGDLVHFNFGPLKVFVLNHPDAIRRVLLDNHRNYSKETFQYQGLSTITGNGLLTSDGEFWLRQRRLVQPAFHRARITALGGMIGEATGRMLRRWETGTGPDRISDMIGAPTCVDVDGEMIRLALEIVGKALFRVDLSAEAQELTGAVLTALDTLVDRSRNPFGPPGWFPTHRNRQFQQALRILDARVYGMIAERRGRVNGSYAGQLNQEHQPEDDLLGMLLASRDPETGASMDDRQLHDEIITLLIAGHETVASALTWTLYLLAKNPEASARLYAEVRLALAGRTPTANDLPALPFTQRVFEEALRLFPPAWIITRKTLQDDELLGYPVPAGSLVVISPYTMHRHPAFWDMAETFDPDRFLPDRSAGRSRFAFIPFGGGPRLCIGDQLARFEAALILASIAQRFQPLLEAAQEVEVEALVTLRPKGGLHMRLNKASA